MTEVIGVRFRQSGKVYYFDPSGHTVSLDQVVIVETERGVEGGYVSIENIHLPEEMLHGEVKSVLRIADDEDQNQLIENEELAKEALSICREKISEHQLDMRLIDAEYLFLRDKLVFYFASDNRVDFRELVRDLAQTFHTRIELRQIGIRDHAKMVGGIGSCGQEVCCRRYMKDFLPVSIKMAKTQGLSLNPVKISGVCGRLMCCLNYEQDVYEENTKELPSEGTLVFTTEGQGYIVDRDVLLKRIRVHVYKPDNTEDEKYFNIDDVEILSVKKKGQRRAELREDLMGSVYQKPDKVGCKSCCGGSCHSASSSSVAVFDSDQIEELREIEEETLIHADFNESSQEEQILQKKNKNKSTNYAPKWKSKHFLSESEESVNQSIETISEKGEQKTEKKNNGYPKKKRYAKFDKNRKLKGKFQQKTSFNSKYDRKNQKQPPNN